MPRIHAHISSHRAIGQALFICVWGGCALIASAHTRTVSSRSVSLRGPAASSYVVYGALERNGSHLPVQCKFGCNSTGVGRRFTDNFRQRSAAAKREAAAKAAAKGKAAPATGKAAAKTAGKAKAKGKAKSKASPKGKAAAKAKAAAAKAKAAAKQAAATTTAAAATATDPAAAATDAEAKGVLNWIRQGGAARGPAPSDAEVWRHTPAEAELQCEHCGVYAPLSKLRVKSKASGKFECKLCGNVRVACSKMKLKLPPTLSDADRLAFFQKMKGAKKGKIAFEARLLVKKYRVKETEDAVEKVWVRRKDLEQSGTWSAAELDLLEARVSAEEGGAMVRITKVSEKATDKSGMYEESSLQAAFRAGSQQKAAKLMDLPAASSSAASSSAGPSSGVVAATSGADAGGNDDNDSDADDSSTSSDSSSSSGKKGKKKKKAKKAAKKAKRAKKLADKHKAKAKAEAAKAKADAKAAADLALGVRYSMSRLAISANCLARRPPHCCFVTKHQHCCFVTKQRGAASRRPSVVFAGGRLAKRFALIANNDVE